MASQGHQNLRERLMRTQSTKTDVTRLLAKRDAHGIRSEENQNMCGFPNGPWCQTRSRALETRPDQVCVSVFIENDHSVTCKESRRITGGRQLSNFILAVA